VERATGVEPATSSLGSWHSTTELRPLSHGNLARKAIAIEVWPRPMVPNVTGFNPSFNQAMPVALSHTRFGAARFLI
jgi:hypothetical protein